MYQRYFCDAVAALNELLCYHLTKGGDNVV